jgi:hypothetical protein
MAETTVAPANNPAASSPADSTQSNLTRANVRGKVPETQLPYHGRKRKAVKMSSGGKQHTKSLMKRGLISPKAASFHGLKT